MRRNAYWRLFGLDLAFGTEDNRPPVYDRADASNGSFVKLFEELLHELWRAMANINNFAGENEADDDRIFRLTEQLAEVLRSRRQVQLLGREELAASTSPASVMLTKDLLNRLSEMPPADAMEYSARLNALTRKTDDFRKGLDAFLRKETPRW